MHALPDAHVIPAKRDETDWWHSFNTTIGKVFTNAPNMDLPPHVREIFVTMQGCFLKETFTDHPDCGCAIAVITQWCANRY